MSTEVELSHDAVRQYVTDTWCESVASEAVKFKHEAEALRLQQQSVELVMTYLRDVPPEDSRPLAVEARLELPLVCPWSGEDLGIPLLGIIDLVLAGQHGATIIDFKTAASAAAPNPLAHEIQLSSYSYLMRAASGRTECELQIRSLIKTKVPKLVVHRYGPR